MTNLRRVLVTGANGFVGQALCEALLLRGVAVRGAIRTIATPGYDKPSHQFEPTAVGAITEETNWAPALEGAEIVIHLAALTDAHHETVGNIFARYRHVNVAATERLARMAAASGVKRLIFMSSVKVNGERTFDCPYTENDVPRPEDAYGISKWEAEQTLASVAKETGLEIIILRSPLVYGPRVKGNFLRLLRLVQRRVPLPLASVHNRRSLIYVGNLIDIIIACLETPAAAGKTYLVSDGDDISTPGLIKVLAAALGVRTMLFPCAVTLLRPGARILGKSDAIARLTESLQVDSSKIRAELGWRPRYAFLQGVAETAKWYRE